MTLLKDNREREGVIIAITFVAAIAIWLGAVMLWQPTASIMVDNVPYRPVLWVISLAALGVPLGFYLSDRHFRSKEANRKTLLVGLALLTTAMVHSLRCFIDTQFIFFLTTIIYFLRDPDRRYRRPMWQYWTVVAYIAWCLITLLWSNDLHYGMKRARNFIPMVAYPAMFLAFTLTTEELYDILKLFWRVALMAVLLSFLSGIYEITVQGFPVTGLLHLRIGMIKETFLNANGEEQFVFNMLYGWSGNGHPSFNAIWATAAAITGIYLFKRRLIGWTEFLFSEFTIIVLQFSAQSRIGIIMVLMTFASGYLYLLWAHRRLVLISAGTALIVVLSLFMIKPDILGSFGRDVTRDLLWQIAIEFIHLKPLQGAGLGGTTAEYVSSVVGYPWPWPEHATENIYVHNQLLDDWMECGVAGFVLSLFMIISTFTMVIRRKSYTGFMFCVAMVVFMYIEMPLRFIQGTTLISFFLCVFVHNTEGKV